jgi:hypothetical protein
MRLRTLQVALASSWLAGCQTLAGGIPQADEPFASDDEFRAWFAFYYKDPHPERVTAALGFMETNHYLDDYPDIAGAFLARVFAANPSALGGWVDDWGQMDGRQWDVIELGLWLCNTEASRTLAAGHVDQATPDHRNRLRAMLARDPAEVDPLTAEVIDPRQINLVWAAFSATGDERYIHKVISYVHLYGEDGDQAHADIGEAAIMTLANNALQHENVARLCQALHKDHPDPRTRLLPKAMLNALAQMAKEGEAPALPSH